MAYGRNRRNLIRKEIRIYVEGGGDNTDGKAAIRRGFGKFLNVVKEQAQAKRMRWLIVAAGSRNATWDAFQTACRIHPSAFNFMLVDSEEAVTNSRKQHLHSRDGWAITQNEDQIHLMVQAMESWVIADPMSLLNFYGQGFQRSAIPANPNVEEISKDVINAALTQATRNTQKGEYHKIRHGATLLELINPELVQDKAPHCKKLFEALEQILI